MRIILYSILLLSIFSCSNIKVKKTTSNITTDELSNDIIEITPIALEDEVINNTIKVSNQIGVSSYQKLKKAFDIAHSGDLVLLDTDVLCEVGDGMLTIDKEIIFRGATKANGEKYKIKRHNKKGTILEVATNNFKIDNILFVNGFQQLIFKGTHENSVVINCSFKDAQYTGLDHRGKFTNYKIIDSDFIDCKFGLQTFDCNVLNDFRVENCTFINGDHQLSLDNPNSVIEKHENIIINNCTFDISERFNIALAKTHNVLISNNTFKGGTRDYSQAIHLEDSTTNVMIYKNSITSKGHVAIILYATDKFGHGQYEKLTEEEKLNYGSGNVTLVDNYIESGNAGPAISIGYGQGYFRIKGNNTIVSGNGQPGISSWNTISNGMSIEIDDNAIIKGKSYAEIKKLGDTAKEFYLKLR